MLLCLFPSNDNTPLAVARAGQTDMLENWQADLPVTAGKINLEFRPFEIKTVHLKLT